MKIEIFKLKVIKNDVFAYKRELKIRESSNASTPSVITPIYNGEDTHLSGNQRFQNNSQLKINRKTTISENIHSFINDRKTGFIITKVNTYRVIDLEDTKELTELLYLDNGSIDIDYSDDEFVYYFWFAYILILLFFAWAYSKSKSYKSKIKSYSDGNNSKDDEDRITFKDVAGEDEAKESLQEIVDFLHNSKKYTKIGAKCPKGALMVGPPGTGKSLLAKAIAGEAKVPFLFRSASEFVEMYVGVGAKRVRELFDAAKRCAPCVVFIDEIDCVGGQRGVYTGGTGGGDSERDQTINQLLNEMDGFGTNKGIVVIAATNRPEMLDQALTRPGRFDRQIVVDRPDLVGREEILKVHAKKVQLDKDVDLHEIALMTTGCVGADLANFINESAILAVKKGRDKVKQEDLKQAIDEVLIGKDKKNRVLTDSEKKTVSWHEAGHALCGRELYGEAQIEKISIVPVDRGGALGYVKPKQTEEKHLKSKEEYDKEIIMLLAGRASEELTFGKDKVTGGCSNDTEKASNIIKAMISMYGMSDEIGLYNVMRQNGQYLNTGFKLECSPELQAQIDELVKTKLKEYYNKSLKILKSNKKILDEIAKYLYEHEKLTDEEFEILYNKLKKRNDNGKEKSKKNK